MNALARFQAAMPIWRPAVEAWLENIPAAVRTDPARAASLTCSPLLRCRPSAPSATATSMEAGSIGGRWSNAPARPELERALFRTARCLAAGDPGPAFGLMLLFPDVEAFYWAHAAGNVFEVVCDRLRRSSVTPICTGR
jgi:hypothetical protein